MNTVRDDATYTEVGKMASLYMLQGRKSYTSSQLAALFGARGIKQFIARMVASDLMLRRGDRYRANPAEFTHIMTRDRLERDIERITKGDRCQPRLKLD